MGMNAIELKKKSGPKPKPLMARFWSKVNKTSTCWIWTAAKTQEGYGVISKGKKYEGMFFAHRISFELFNGPLLRGLVIDHQCNNPSCVNPAHLRQVTTRQNVLRGIGPSAVNANKQICKRGHIFDKENTQYYCGGRVCRKCKYLSGQARRAAKKWA